MTQLIDIPLRDVMQVCMHGHVITDLLHAYPDRGLSHCDRCGAPTMERCATCGQEIPGAVHVQGFVAAGRSLPPEFCSSCGAAFPWNRKPEPGVTSDSMASLEKLLRRLPLVIRQLRSRHGTRPAFQVADERDLEDLLRALLPIFFDDIRLETRTPPYDSGTRTDLRIKPEEIVVTAKRASSRDCEKQISNQLQQDVAFYGRNNSCKVLLAYVYDPEGFLRDPAMVESMWCKLQDHLELRCIISG